MGLKEVWSGWVSVPVPTGGGRGRRASFTGVNSCAHYIVCPENLVGQRKILDAVSVEKFTEPQLFISEGLNLLRSHLKVSSRKLQQKRA